MLVDARAGRRVEYAHDHLFASEERVADELARAQGHLSVGHVDVWRLFEGCGMDWRWLACRQKFSDWGCWKIEVGAGRLLPEVLAIACWPEASTLQSLSTTPFDCELTFIRFIFMDPQLILFRRQYFQLFDTAFLCWPPKQLLRDIDVQGWLYTNLFDAQRNLQLPPESYQIRILKPLLNKIENAIEDPEEDVGLSRLAA